MEIFENIFKTTGTLSVEQIILNIVVALVMGGLIYLSYLYTHAGTIYSTKFNISLVMLTIVTAIVMTVIQNNIALSLGTIGALSIVRFRTAIKDPRDTIYIFWAISMGLCCGISCYTIAIIGAIVIFIFLLLFGRIKNNDRLLIVVKGDRKQEAEIESVIFTYFNSTATLRVKNTSEGKCEFIYEISRKNYNKSQTNEKSITDTLYKIKNIDYVNIVTQNDEING
jgi:uncharacterized membrane protein YhiD involved in acid resistance